MDQQARVPQGQQRSQCGPQVNHIGIARTASVQHDRERSSTPPSQSSLAERPALPGQTPTNPAHVPEASAQGAHEQQDTLGEQKPSSHENLWTDKEDGLSVRSHVGSDYDGTRGDATPQHNQAASSRGHSRNISDYLLGIDSNGPQNVGNPHPGDSDDEDDEHGEHVNDADGEDTPDDESDEDANDGQGDQDLQRLTERPNREPSRSNQTHRR